MSFCLKAIKTLNDSDLGALTDGIESYVKAGMETQAAERAAVNDMLAQVAEDRKELMGLIEQQHPAPAAQPEPVKPRTMFDPDIPFMRKGASAGQHVEDVQAVVDAITDTWANAPDVVVLETFDQAPASVKAMNDAQLQGEAKGVPAAFVSGGKVYIVADQMTSDGGVVRALFHEALGHLGLRGTFGPKLGVILDELADANQEQVAAKAKQYGLDMTKAADRRSAAEEVLAEMAEKSPDATWVQRAIAAVKDFLRKLGIKLKYSDADIVAQFIVPARRFVTEGRPAVVAPTEAKPTVEQAEAPMNADDEAFMRLSDIRSINQEKARNLFLDAVTSHGNVSAWGKTVGTQYHKAKKNPQTFGKVFTAVQDYIKDISVFANAAADKAPTILPKLENWTDLKKGGFTRHGADKKDLKAAGAAVFQGTLEYLRGPDGKLVQVDAAKNLANRMNTKQKGRELMKAGKVSEQVLKMWQGLPQDQYDTIIEGKYDRDMLRAGVVFTDAELKSMFKLTPDQIGLYREFRAATDQSLDDLVRTEMVRLAGKGEVPLAQEVMAAPSIGAALKILQDHLDRLSVENPGDKADNDKTFNLIADKVGSVERLKAEGYAPLMRFGRHTLHIQKDGETVFFGMYESRSDANEAAREMRKDTEFQGAEFKQGLMSQEAYKLYAGMSLEALELFAESTGNANNPVYQDYLKLAKSNRSAMKRMIHRQGIAGFSEDASRVLASFVTSNSRMAAGNLHLGAAKEAAEAIPKEMGDLKDDAINLVKYVQDPQEEAAAVRGLLFTTFIGGSVASAAVNLTQPMTMTLPYLSQFGGAIKAGRHILAATRMAAGGKVEGEIAEALKRAEADGIVSPQEIHHLQAEAMGRLGAHPMLKKFSFIWGSMFSLAEQFNRRVSFISAYNVAKENHLADPFAFAEQAVIETQGLYNKGNSANWARGPIGKTAMTFKQFSTHYLEFLQRMATAGEPGSKERRDGRKAVGVALAILMLVAGAGGLPFADDLDDLIDTLAQSMGYDFNAKAAKKKFISETLGLGDTAADFVTRGATSLPGMPIDLSVRMGLGNLLPGTGALLRSNTDRSRDVLEFAGAAGGLAKSAMDEGNLLLQGELTDAAIRMAPVALQNMAKSVQMWNTGQYRNQKDQKVTDVDQIDAAAKFVGFQPRNVASESASMGRIQRSIQLARNVEEQIAGKWAQGANDLDQEKVAEARQDLADWNEKNPSTPIKITSSQIIARVRAMRTSRADRTVKAAPKELRPMVREGFQ